MGIVHSRATGSGSGRKGKGELESDSDYAKIKKVLMLCDKQDWAFYLNNFQRHKMTDKRLETYIHDAIWEPLIPDLGVRLDFKALFQTMGGTTADTRVGKADV